MKVANAIYDVVFKYLMEDRNIARLLLSGLLRTEVLDIDLKPQEYSTSITEKSLTVYRIDFKARIRASDGKEKLVLIELQKAKLPSDIMRFRRYLGRQYANKDNVVIEGEKKQALPIITIYFLGYAISGLEEIPIIRIARQYLDHSTGEELNVRSEFIESLTHDSIIVQVEAIKRKRRKTELEKVLSIFEPGTRHEISIDEDDYPERYRPIIRRLLKAVQDDRMRETMEIEDEILEDLQAQERATAQEREARRKAEEKVKIEAKARKRAEEEKKRAEEKMKIEAEARRKAEEEKRRAEEKVKIEAEARKRAEEKMKMMMRSLAIRMLREGEPIENVIEETGLNEEEIRSIGL